MNASDLIGRTVSFDHWTAGTVARLVGVITEAKDNGRTARGDIPDFLVTVRGASGKTLTISFVETYCRITS